MAEKSEKITTMILSGGSGTRLWPMSTPATPKQFLALTGKQTMFQQTLERVRDDHLFSQPIIVANARHGALIGDQMAEIGIAPRAIILEPCARNTAPAIALAAIEAGSVPMLVMPSDHVVTDVAAFHSAIAAALPFVNDGWMVTFGITPDAPETGYGYIKIGDALGAGVHRVERFMEKPARAAAEAMLASGGHAWNGGIFLLRGDIYLSALREFAPDMLRAAEAAMAEAKRDGAQITPDEAAFAACPSDSIDYAVMEKASKVAVVPVSMGWSDLGSWDALYALQEGDEAGNVASEGTRLIEAKGNLVQSDGLRISITGVDDLIVIASGNEVLILPRGQSQDVKKFSG